jgi:hypothetical protein
MPPTSQRDRPISFHLWDGGGLIASHQLYVRPEEISYDDPGRISVQQTLGGAWADEFGRGLTTISLRGITGWRGNQDGDGERQFHALRQDILDGYYEARARASASNSDPDRIQIIFVDALNDRTMIGAPQSFRLQRSKSRPLLFQYAIQLIGLAQHGEVSVQIEDAIAEAMIDRAGRRSSSIQRMLDNAGAIGGLVGALPSGLREFAATSADVFTQAAAVAADAASVIASTAEAVIGVAEAVSQVGANIFWVLAEQAGVDYKTMQRYMTLASRYSDMYCTIRNGIRVFNPIRSFDGLFGASNCSSTGGGNPPSVYADVNAFGEIFASSGSRVQVSGEASQEMSAWLRDTLTLAGSTGIPESAGIISRGIALAA